MSAGWTRGIGTSAGVMLVLILGAAGCGDAGEASSTGKPWPTSTAELSTAPSTSPEPGETTDPRVASYVRRCVEATQQLEDAQFRYDAHPRMALGREQDYRAVLQPLGPSLTLSPTETGALPDSKPVAVTCLVSARLSIADADEAPEGWEERIFVPPDPVSWDWMVTPRRDGTLDGVLSLKPAALVQLGEKVERRILTQVDLKIDVSVQKSVWDRVTEWTNQVTTVQKLLVAIAALTSAGLALWGLFRHRAATSTSASPGPGSGSS